MPIPKEIPVNLMQEREVAQGNTNLFGPISADEIAAHDNRELRDDAFSDMFVDALKLDNFGVNVYDYVSRKNKYDADPDYNFMDHADMLTQDVPSVWHDKFKGAASLDEALDLRDSIVSEVRTAERLADNGITGSLARIAAGVIDVDMAIPFIGPAKKMSVFAKAARAGLHGAGTAGLTEAGLATFGETNDWSTVPAATIMGLAMGGAIGAIQPKVGLTVDIQDITPLEHALFNAKKKAGTVYEYYDQIAEGVLGYPTARLGVREAEDAARQYGAKEFKYLGGGSSAAVVDAGDNVIRVEVGQIHTRVDSEHVLQPIERGFNWELLPKADRTGITEADVDTMRKLLDAENIDFIDPGVDQLGRVNGKLVVLDPGAVKHRTIKSELTKEEYKAGRAFHQKARESGLEGLVRAADTDAVPIKTNMEASVSTKEEVITDTKVEPEQKVEPELPDPAAALYRDVRSRTDFIGDDVNMLREFGWKGDPIAPKGKKSKKTKKDLDPATLKMVKEAMIRAEAKHTDEVKALSDTLIENAQDPAGIAEIDGLDHVINEYSGARVFVGDEGNMGERAAKFSASLETREALKSGYPKRVRDAMATGPLKDDATRLWNSGSPTMRSLAASLFEFSDALIVNNKSGAMLSEFLFGHTYKVFDQVYNQVASASFKRKGFGALDFKAKTEYLKDLNMRAMMQANDLNLGKIIKLDDDVADILAGVRDLSEKFRREGAGGWGGARPVPGFEKLDAKAAYIPMPWNPDRLRGVLRNLEKDLGSKTEARTKLSGAIKQAYMAANPDMEEEVANQVALALVRRQLAKGDIEDTNIQALLKDDDSRDLLIQAFKDNGVSEDQAELLMQKIAGSDTDKGRVSYGRRRTNIDLAGEYDGIKMIDLVDPDLQKTMLRYSDTMSKRVALTRHGIDSKRKIEAIKLQAKKEMTHLNQADKAELEKFLDYMFEYFEPGTVDKHINPWMRRAKATTNLSLLSKLMITQGAETGAIISATGMKNFIQASKVLREASKGAHKKALMDDFGFLLGNAAYESGLMRSDFVTDAALDIMTSSSPIARTFDAVLAKGQHFQSMLSGYTKVIESQLKLGAIAGTNKIFRQLKAGKASELTDMFGSMGLDSKAVPKLQKLIDDGTIEFDAAGHVDKLNVQKWPMDIREDFGLASLRLARTMTQRALAGESIQWLHDPSWAIFGHLQSFPLLAMRKQFLRNMGRKDGHMLSLATWGLGTATIAAMLSSMTEGTDMTPEYLARRAFSLNNAIGWVAPGLDLFATMTGLEEYSPGGRYAQDVSIPLLSVATRAQGIPEALAGLLPGMEFDASDKRALQVLPVVGSAVFMGRVWDAARTDNEE